MSRPATVAVASPRWIDVACVLCDDARAQPVLPVGHADAPDGRTAIVECVGCGLRRLTPRPGGGELPGYYDADQVAFAGRRRGALKQALWDVLRDVAAGRPGKSRLLAPLRPLARWCFDVNVSLAGPRPPAVLDVGSGYGDLLVYLQERGCRVTGVDTSPRAVERARALGIPVRLGPLRELRLAEASFDVGVLCHSLEHVADPVAELREVARLVRPGGSVHVAVPNGRAGGLRLEGEAWEHVSVPLHLWFFDARTLARALRTAGLEPIGPVQASSSYRPLARMMREARAGGRLAAAATATRRLWAAWGHECGDVLRVVARRP
jgi:SAM-dependent methyltransferase